MFKERRLTPNELFKKSEYGLLHESISVEAIEEHLQHHQELVDRWIMYSGDKRWKPSWAFFKNKSSGWTVVYVNPEAELIFELIFDNQITACAVMIRLEFEEWRVRK